MRLSETPELGFSEGCKGYSWGSSRKQAVLDMAHPTRQASRLKRAVPTLPTWLQKLSKPLYLSSCNYSLFCSLLVLLSNTQIAIYAPKAAFYCKRLG